MVTSLIFYSLSAHFWHSAALMFYASTQTLEAEADPNIPTGKTNPDAQRDHD